MEFDLAAWAINVGTTVGTTIFLKFVSQWWKKRRSSRSAGSKRLSKKVERYHSTMTCSDDNIKVEIKLNKDIHKYKVTVNVDKSAENETEREDKPKLIDSVEAEQKHEVKPTSSSHYRSPYLKTNR